MLIVLINCRGSKLHSSVYPKVSGLSHNKINNINKHSLRIERIVLLDFIHRLVFQEQTKLKN
jgi:hypothetical protein